MKVIKRLFLTLYIVTIMVGLPSAMLIWGKPGTPVVFQAFIDKATYAYMTNSSYSQWLRMLARYSEQEPVLLSDVGIQNTFKITSKLITKINYVVNNIKYAHDEDTYGPREYFATPREMLDRGRGDCEDYAILKMHLLVSAGFPPEDLFLLAGIYDDGNNIGGHAVLAIIINDEVWIMDNMRNSIIPLRNYTQFEPMAAMNWSKFKLMGVLRN